MNLEEIIEELKELNEKEDLIGSGNRIQELKRLFEDVLLKEESAEQVKALKFVDEGLSYEKKEFDDVKETYKTQMANLLAKRKKQFELKTTLEKENLNQKKDLLHQLKSLVENEEKIGSAFHSLKVIQETWNKIGDIPRDFRGDIQKEYSRLIELFFYNINIYKELKEHDLKRNLQLKEDVIFRLKNLRNSKMETNLLESELRNLQNEWEEIGPVENDQWELLKENYWETVRGIYEKINQYYSDLKEKRKEIIEEKKKLIQETADFINGLPESEKMKDWDQATNVVLEFQKKWKNLGNGPRKENDQVWKEFRTECDRFFSLKKNYFDTRKKSHSEAANKKVLLIEELKKLDLQADWKENTKKVIQLQNNWKKIGFSGKEDQRLWKEFRALCDRIFSTRDQFQKEQNETLHENLVKRKEYLNHFKDETFEGDRKELQSKVHDCIRAFDDIGEISFKELEKLNKEFKAMIFKKLNSAGVDDSSIEKINFQVDIIGIKDKQQRLRFLQRERGICKKNREKILAEINQLENNIGFFANSKKSESLLTGFEDQIVGLKRQLSKIESKLNSIPNE